MLLASDEFPGVISADCRLKLEGRLPEISLCLEANERAGALVGPVLETEDNVFFEFKPQSGAGP